MRSQKLWAVIVKRGKGGSIIQGCVGYSRKAAIAEFLDRMTWLDDEDRVVREWSEFKAYYDCVKIEATFNV